MDDGDGGGRGGLGREVGGGVGRRWGLAWGSCVEELAGGGGSLARRTATPRSRALAAELGISQIGDFSGERWIPKKKSGDKE